MAATTGKDEASPNHVAAEPPSTASQEASVDKTVDDSITRQAAMHDVSNEEPIRDEGASVVVHVGGRVPVGSLGRQPGPPPPMRERMP